MQSAIPPEAPKKKMPLWKKIVIGIAGFVVLAVVAVTFAFWATSGLVAPVERQLAALKRGDIAAAYAETSITFRDTTPLPEFTAFVKRYPGLSRNASYSFNERAVDASGTGRLKGALTDDRGGVLPVEYRLVKENDQWRISAIRIE